jgi:pilus assembly protein Flp/PilA
MLTFLGRHVYPDFRWIIVFGYPTGKWREKAETWHTLTRLADRGMFYDQRLAAMSAAFHLGEGIRLMLKFYVKGSDLLTRLREDKDGVVSFEYIVVAALVIAAVGLAYGTGAGSISGALSTGITTLTTKFTGAI